MSFNFSLGFSNLKDIPFHMYDNDFTFHINDKAYKTNRFIADIISPYVRNLHYSDKSINSFCIDIKNSDMFERNKQTNERIDYFSEFLESGAFKDIKIDPERYKYYSYYFYVLGNTDELLHLQSQISEGINEHNAIDRLLLLTSTSNEYIIRSNSKDSNPIEKIINFIAENFENIDKEKMKELNISTIELIINNQHLKLKEEDSLLQFLLELYEKDSKSSELFEYIIFNNVSEELIVQFINIFDIEYLNKNIWKSICQRITYHSKIESISRYIQKVGKNKFKKFERKEGKEFEGIMKYLSDKTGGNIDRNGTIEITSNSIYNFYHPRNLVDYNDSKIYQSDDREGKAFICFDFKDKSVNLSSYTIKSNSNYTSNSSYNLKSWSIEVSNDGENWEEIDRHVNDSTLNGRFIVHNFKVKKVSDQFYRFVRLRQLGDSWSPSDHKVICFYLIEFYGGLKCPINQSLIC